MQKEKRPTIASYCYMKFLSIGWPVFFSLHTRKFIHGVRICIIEFHMLITI